MTSFIWHRTDSVWAWSSVNNQWLLQLKQGMCNSFCVVVVSFFSFICKFFPFVCEYEGSLQQCVCFYRLWNFLTSHHTVLNSSKVSKTFPRAPFKNTLICSLCCSTQQHTFGPMDYESLQKELALKDTMWTKVSPTECNEDSSTTVVYRMETVGDGN